MPTLTSQEQFEALNAFAFTLPLMNPYIISEYDGFLLATEAAQKGHVYPSGELITPEHRRHIAAGQILGQLAMSKHLDLTFTADMIVPGAEDVYGAVYSVFSSLEIGFDEPLRSDAAKDTAITVFGYHERLPILIDSPVKQLTQRVLTERGEVPAIVFDADAWLSQVVDTKIQDKLLGIPESEIETPSFTDELMLMPFYGQYICSSQAAYDVLSAYLEDLKRFRMGLRVLG